MVYFKFPFYLCLSTFHSTAGNACDDLFRQEKIQDKGRQKHDYHCRKHAGPVASVFHRVNHRIQSHSNRTQFVRVGENQGDEILIPDIDKVKYRYRDDSWLSHGKHDQPEGFGWRATVDSRRFLKSTRQIAEKGHEEYGGVRNIDANV